MYVLMDIEWYQANNVVFVTQIAAMRINANFEAVDTFFRRICPPKFDNIQWKHVGFSGALPAKFLCADDAKKVFEDLDTWFLHSDTLLWWHESSQAFFRMAYGAILNEVVPYCMWILRPGIKKILKDGLKNRGTPYELCLARNIKVQKPEHNALNDADTIRRLLYWINEPIGNLTGPVYDSLENTVTPPPLSAFTDTHLPAGNPQSRKYVLDPTTALVHHIGCILIKCSEDCLRVVSQKTCLQAKLQPCTCCQSEIEAIVRSKTGEQEIVSVFSSKQSSRHIVHYAHCRVLSRIPDDRIKTFSNMAEAKMNGYHLCKYCASIERFYKPVKERAQTFCRETGLSCVFNGGALHISSGQDFWRIIIDELTGKPALYHRNKIQYKKKTKDMPIENYHKQLTQSHKILVLLRQIVDHDKYVEGKEAASQQAEQKRRKDPGYNPPAKRSKKGQKLARKQKNNQKRKQIARTLAIIDELEALRKKC